MAKRPGKKPKGFKVQQGGAAGRGKHLREMAIVVRERRRKVAEMLIQGVQSQTEMALRLGCSQPTISNDIAAVFDQWLRDDIRKVKRLRLYRLRQLERAGLEAYQGYQISRQNAEEVHTAYERESCPECVARRIKEENTGKKPVKPSNGSICGTCGGRGYQLVENITRRVKGQAGDAALLRIYLDSLKEIAKLQGLYPKEKDGKANGLNVHLHANKYDFSKLSTDDLLRVKGTLDQARIEHSRTVDVPSESVDESS